MKTPMMEQFDRIKAEHRDEILLFRMGDFYETFREDARIVSRVLGITLTARARNKSTGESIPLAGFPWHALDGYMSRLVRAGYRVAICEQTEDPATAKGLVNREVIEVVTPGTLVSGSALDDRSVLLLCAVNLAGSRAGLAFCDLSTGDMEATELNADLMPAEVARRAPSEVLASSSLVFEAPHGSELTGIEDWKFDPGHALEKIRSVLEVATPEGLGLTGDGPALGAIGALLTYVEDTKRSVVSHLGFAGMYRREDSLILDRGSARALSITEALPGEESGILADGTDGTVTPAGAREWRKWLSSPCRDPNVITGRYDAVEWLAGNLEALRELRAILVDSSDLQRQAGKLGTLRSAPRDLRAVAETLKRLPAISAILAGSGSSLLSMLPGEAPPEEVLRLIDSTITDSPPARISDGSVIREGISEELDQLREIRSGGKEWITSREELERKETGISNLSIGYNRVFGYYIEVSKSNLDRVPGHYIRKQTLVNAERFITPDLKEMEARVLRASEEIERLETVLFSELRQDVAGHSHEIRATGKGLAALDVLCGLADMASRRSYCRPCLSEKPRLSIEGGRHPVLNEVLPQGECVPNDLELDGARRILLVTGPNMAGKSTYLRQAALLVVMAQAGSFVPADSMTFSPVDRIFTRIGSSDRITRGHSTFLVEMAEAAALLNSSTEWSLAILDEVGRGTSTYDGLSLAWAMVEYLHENQVHRPMVLFATHYHELTALGSILPAVANVNVRVEDTGNRVVFLYRVEEGKTDDSYGIHVASMAGVPRSVVKRARKVLTDLEAGRHLMPGGISEDQLELPLSGAEELPEHPVMDELREVDPDSITPRSALEILYRLRDMLEG